MKNVPEIKAGYLLEINNKNTHNTFLAMVLPCTNGEISVSSPEEWYPLSRIEETFEYYGDIINKIYGYAGQASAYKISTGDRKLLWDRNAPKNMTKKEIEKELGYKIEIVGE